MKTKKRHKRSWVRRFLCSTALGLSSMGGLLHAQEPPSARTIQVVSPVTEQQPVNQPAPIEPGLAPTFPTGNFLGDTFAPAWVDPVSQVPNFFGGFVDRGTNVQQTTFSTQTLKFTGAGGEGFTGGGFVISPPLTVNGPKGPYTLNQGIPYPLGPSNFALPQNNELTPKVQANFPGAIFVNGGGTNQRGDLTFFYDYLFSSGQNVSVNLPNPSGGGPVGHNLYFENGSPVPRDRVYFFYNHVGNFQGLGTPFDVNRYVFGVEKTFLNDLFSVELRVPFAGTANGDQVVGQELSVDHGQFGNLGLAFKSVLYHTPNFIATVGMGFSFPTASDSRMLLGDTPIAVIQNRTCILQPMLGVAWAPNDRFYTQLGLQFDIDPSGNPVQVLDGNGGLTRAGVLHDQTYAFVKAATGYWIYQNGGGRLSAIALQGELDFDRSFGSHDPVSNGPITVTDLTSRINVLNGNAGAIFQFGERTRLSVGVGFPLGGDHLYHWNLTCQLNYQFGRR